MATINTQQVPNGGLLAFAAAAAGGDTFDASPDVVVVFKNTNAATRTATVVVPGNLPYGPAAPDVPYTIPAIAGSIPGEVWIPMRPEYADPATGRAQITYSTEANVTVAAFKVR